MTNLINNKDTSNINNKSIRVRLAPSPTSALGLHVGNLRTHLYNYAFAKKHGGTIVYRLEDTDVARNNPDGVKAIRESFEWTGLLPDEGYTFGGEHGPYSQLERLDIYKKFADKLMNENKAYKCFCSQEDLESQRKRIELENEKNGKKTFFKYPGTCRSLTKEQIFSFEKEGKDYVIRLKVDTSGYTEYEDLVFGKIVTPNKEQQDFIIIRSNNIPLYSMGCVIDDITMKISIVVRGADHQINTPIQCLIYKALDAEVPQFAHLPLMRGQQDNLKLSKRHASTSVLEYKKLGYSPDAVISYLAKMGWGHADIELFTINDIIAHFDFRNVKKGDCRFDPVKFLVINHQYLKSETLTPTPTYAKLLKPFIDARDVGQFSIEELCRYVPLCRVRARTFVEAADLLVPVLKATEAPSELVTQTFNKETQANLASLKNMLVDIKDWSETNLKPQTTQWLKEKNLSLKDIGASLRLSLLGTPNSPEIFQVMAAIGKDSSLARIERMLVRLQSGSN